MKISDLIDFGGLAVFMLAVYAWLVLLSAVVE